MAHRMGMKVVAEGIENKQQSEFLCTHGCDYLQGYYIINQCLRKNSQSCWINNEKQQKTASVK